MSNEDKRRKSSLAAVEKPAGLKKAIKKEKMDGLKKEIEMDEHKISMDELCSRLETSTVNGLTQVKADELFKKHGKNALTPPKETPEWVKFLKQMSNGFAILLWCGSFFSMIAYVITVATDPNADKANLWLSIVLAVVVFITGCFQYFQESKSGKIMDSFKKMLPPQATVIRDGQKQTISATNLTIGDLVQVDLGTRVPADIRIVTTSGLKVDNSSLTGESEPLTRSPECTHNNPLETKNLAFFSTFAVEGSGTGIVVKIGDNTVMGRIASLATGLKNDDTHLAKEIRHFIHIVTVVAFSFGFTFFFISIGLGYPIVSSFVFLIGVVVANVPEGLMACLTVCLALTAKRMAKKNCLIKHLEAVEALGAIGIICSDKTGTLTMNRMTVSHMWLDNSIIRVNLNDPKDKCHAFENQSFEEASVMERRKSIVQKPKGDSFDNFKSESWNLLTRCAILCNRAEFKSDPENMAKEPMKRICNGDASETAIVQYSEHIIGNVMKYRQDWKKVGEIPFNSTNKYQVSIHEFPNKSESGRLLVMKGAPERILEHCSKIIINGKEEELTTEWRDAFNKSYEALGGMGERVLGFCDEVLSFDEYPTDVPLKLESPEEFPPKNLRFLGFISLIDPPKPNVPEAVAKVLID
jgi:sodium/potassium-transporting ATPase subunit alpha